MGEPFCKLYPLAKKPLRSELPHLLLCAGQQQGFVDIDDDGALDIFA
jgi:hypothetical protein